MKKLVFISLLFLLFSCKNNSVSEAFLEMGDKADEKSTLIKKEIESNIHQIDNNSLKKLILEYNSLTKEHYAYLNSLVIELSKNDEQEDLFFENGEYTLIGAEFVKKEKYYRETILKIARDEQFKNKISTTLNTDSIKNRDGKEIDWLKYNFEGFPKFAVITKLKTIQLDILQLENEFIDNILNKND